MKAQNDAKHQEKESQIKENQTNDAIAQQRALSEELKAMTTFASNASQKKIKKEKRAEFCPTLQTKKCKNWDLILAAFKKLEGMMIDKKSGALIFESHEAAVEFFLKQAKAGYEFFVSEYIGDQPSGFHFFSCGDQQLYQGTLKEIKAQLEAEIQKNPTNNKAFEGLKLVNENIKEADVLNDNPANKMRNTLKENRHDNVEPTSGPSPSTKSTR